MTDITVVDESAGEVTVTLGSGVSVVLVDTVSQVTVAGAGAQGPAGPQNLFVQDVEPDHPGPFVWFDTTGGNLQIKYEDGL